MEPVDYIKRIAISQAKNIKLDPSQLGPTYMRSYMFTDPCACESCDQDARTICEFDTRSSFYYLCDDHVRQYKELQAAIITDDVIMRRTRLIGPHYNIIKGHTNMSLCNLCWKFVGGTTYWNQYSDTSICSQCKQKSIRYNMMIYLLLLPEIISLTDIRTHIRDTIYTLITLTNTR